MLKKAFFLFPRFRSHEVIVCNYKYKLVRTRTIFCFKKHFHVDHLEITFFISILIVSTTYTKIYYCKAERLILFQLIK